jgi:spore germination cell wall hydrolase CwlJ-like protein
MMFGLRVGLAALVLVMGIIDRSSAQDPKAAQAEEKAEVLEEKIAVQPEPEPVKPAERITAAESKAVDPEGHKPLDDAITCLARTIYWEAKGEGDAGMSAVAAVVMNRLADPDFPKTVCAVVTQGKETGACQFSWWCDGRPDDVEEEKPYAQATEIARRALNQQLPDPTNGAVNFHTMAVQPAWADDYVKTARIGDHIFYRSPQRTADAQ